MTGHDAPTVRVVRFGLDVPASMGGELDRVLPGEERDVSARRRVARAVARLELASLLGVEARALVISRRCAHCGDAAHGRPVVADAPQLDFSLSHSGAYGLLAIAADAGPLRLGADVERVVERRNLDRLAARVLDPADFARWSARPPAARLEAFLRSWTRKEAYLKALGRGITTRLAQTSGTPTGWAFVPVAVDGAVAVVAADRAIAVDVVDRSIEPISSSAGAGG